jgi:hypothetical protein
VQEEEKKPKKKVLNREPSFSVVEVSDKKANDFVA